MARPFLAFLATKETNATLNSLVNTILTRKQECYED
jgi:hypothetical protein